MRAARRRGGGRRAFPGSFSSPFLDRTRCGCARCHRTGARSLAAGGGRVTLRAGRPASACGSCGAWRGPLGYATGPPAGVCWRSRWSGRGTRALIDVPSSSCEQQRVVAAASGTPAPAAPSSGTQRQLRAAWRSARVWANPAMRVVGVSPTGAVPGIDATFWAETPDFRAVRPSAMGRVRSVGSLWAQAAQGMISRPGARASGR